MQDKPLFYIVVLAVLIVLGILATGIGGFARGGEFNRKHGNRLMRWRIIAQAVAIALILLFIWLRSS
ncbi:twin transmembrane helix small protein [Paracoccus seriniphilus]|uniref:Hypoxia induced protein conserved region n=1 Tax=Paracoccus seriniphilus TaxID=184748 RepID=A0A239Q2L4_9RHOB|nr:twin transmembrane helix small protein [Paracoccus seriniphilus]WCR14451.1 twin transmembrane helix small protein [Paracoccus seriniphilus]SNT76432.1 Hypoxia induced protein conserved region [Paracoccus seriniphilus]